MYPSFDTESLPIASEIFCATPVEPLFWQGAQDADGMKAGQASVDMKIRPDSRYGNGTGNG